ncbi:hypothetical protein ACHQM5_030003 [Ranunculus cassubicifolius]
MDHPVDNENPPRVDSRLQLNEDADFVANNLGQSPTCANLLGNMDGQPRGHDMIDDNDNTTTDESFLSNFWTPEVYRSPSNDGNMTDRFLSESLHREAALASHFHDSTNFTSLFDNNQRSQVGVSDRCNAEVQRHSIRGSAARYGTPWDEAKFMGSDSQISTGTTWGDPKFMGLAPQLNTFSAPQVAQSDASIGGNTTAGVSSGTQVGSGNDMSQVRYGNSNNDIRNPPPFNNSHSLQTVKGSMVIGDKRANIMRRNTQWGATTATSHVQTGTGNTHSSMNVARQSNSLQGPQINKSSRAISGKKANAVQRDDSRDASIPNVVQSNRQGRRGRFRVDDVRVDDNRNANYPFLVTNLRGQESKRIPIGMESGFPSRMHVNSKDVSMGETCLGSQAFLLDENRGSVNDKNCLNVGGNMPKVRKSPVRVKRDAKRFNSTNPSNSATFSEQINNTYRNLRFGDNPGVALQSNAFGVDLSSRNGCPITAQSYTPLESDGNFLSLGGILGNQTLSNQANTINSGTIASVHSNPYTSLGGNIRNQTWANNFNRIVSGTNAGVNSTLRPFLPTVQGNMRQYAQRPSGGIVGAEGNGPGLYVDRVPYRGFHGHSGMDIPSLGSIPAGLNIDEQAGLSSLPAGPSSLMGNPNASFLTPPQQAYTSNIFNPSMPSTPNRTSSRTFQLGQSGNPIQVDDTEAEAAHIIASIPSISSNQSQTNQGTSRISQRGKRAPSDGIQDSQSSKVLLGPSIRGNPVPVATRAGFAHPFQGPYTQTLPNAPPTLHAPVASHVRFSHPSHGPYPQTLDNRVNFSKVSPALRAPIARRVGFARPPSQGPYTQSIDNRANPPNASPTHCAPHGRKVFQPSKTQPKISHHLQWAGFTETWESSGEKCCLCKRDLTYAPTGEFAKPDALPAVAILPCGHTFHDECLQNITPEDDLKNPPCIPCAID